jgi:hypothetical protein
VAETIRLEINLLFFSVAFVIHHIGSHTGSRPRAGPRGWPFGFGGVGSVSRLSRIDAMRARQSFPYLALGQDRFDEGLLLIGRVPDVQSGWLVRSVLLSGATGPNQDHLTVPNHRPVPPATLRLQVIRRVPDVRAPHEVALSRTETKSRLGVIIEVSSPFWPITALAISMTSGAVGLSPFADPLSPAGPAGLNMRSVTPLRSEAQFKTLPGSAKAVDNYQWQDWIWRRWVRRQHRTSSR